MYRDRDAQGLAAALARLADDAHRARCASAGWSAVVERYHWERDAEQLLSSLERAAGGARAAAAGSFPGARAEVPVGMHAG